MTQLSIRSTRQECEAVVAEAEAAGDVQGWTRAMRIVHTRFWTSPTPGAAVCPEKIVVSKAFYGLLEQQLAAQNARLANEVVEKSEGILFRSIPVVSAE